MDWDLAIKRNSEELNRFVAALFAMLGLAGVAPAGRIPQPLHRAVLRVLWPAESAMRRLIVIAARGLVVKLASAASRPKLKGPIGKGGGGSKPPSFQLFDTRKNFAVRRGRRFTRLNPRIHFFGSDPTVASLWAARQPLAAPAPPPDGLVNGERISRRLIALKLVLEDLPRQARRLARWRVRRENTPGVKFTSPLRPGPPPGHRKKKVHEVDEVLAQCHWLAWDAMRPDTS